MHKLLINGVWSDAFGGTVRGVANPATLESLGVVVEGGAEDVRRAVVAATAAQARWRGISPAERARVLVAIGARIRAMAGTLADLLTKESGTPLCESADCVDWAAQSFERQGAHPGAEAGRAADGVTAVVGSFHFAQPLLGPTVASVVAAGNSLLCKPPRQCTLANLKLSEAFDVLPPGVVNVIPGGMEVERALLQEPGIALTIVDGSGATTPSIVLADADLDVAVAGVAWQSLWRCGQARTASKRIYVQDSCAGEFADRLHEFLAFLEVGDPARSDTDMGPLATLEAARTVEAQIAYAAKEGARLKMGGRAFQPWGLRGHFLQPTILTHVPPDGAAARAEILGPVLLVVPVAGAAEAFRRAFGEGERVAARVFTRDPARVRDALRCDAAARWIDDDAAETEAGWRNAALGLVPRAPRQLEHIAAKRPWWFPYRERRADGTRGPI
jgi:acyl-CoA reductase-like NAD-dependent aldehyde dehydrogenase